MSALAVRRAALAAKAAIAADAPTPSPPPTKPTTRSKKAAAKPAPPPPTPPSPTLSDFSGVSDASEESAGPSNKRRKVAKKGKQQPAEKKDAAARYFVGVEIPTRGPPKQPPKSRRQRAFSPSAAVEETDGEETGESSGEEEGTEPVQAEDAAPWSGAPSPWEQRVQPATAVVPCSSFFEVEDGVNFTTLTEEQLAEAGVESTGPGVVISIRVQESLAIAGTYTVTPLQGSLSLLSTTLTPFSGVQPVFAPTSHPLPILARADDELSQSELLDALPLPKSFDLRDSQTVFLLQENRTGIEGLRGDVVPGFSNIWLSDEGVWGLRGVHPVLDNFPSPVYPYVTPESWTRALASLGSSTATNYDSDDSDDSDDELSGTPPPVVIVKGAKRSGKSSLARASLNALLRTYASVAWLECDLGQGEFSPGGAVGLWILEQPLLGPAFTHPRSASRAVYLGELSPASCADEYMAAIQALISHYQYEVQRPLSFGEREDEGRRTDAVPLVINTQGWVKGLGEELMYAIEAAAAPTHVFAFEAPEVAVREGWTMSPQWTASDLPSGAPWEVARNGRAQEPMRFTVEPAPSSPLQARYSAADMRALATMSYLHSTSGTKWDFSVPLIGMRPWTVDLGPDGALKAAYVVGEGADAVSVPDLPLALNGSLVGLLEADPASTSEAYVPGRSPPGVEDATLLGIALVRAVRTSEDGRTLSLQLVTPLGAEELKRATAVVRNGALELPTCGLLDWRERVPGGGVSEDGLAGVRWDDVPFFDAAGAEAVGAGRRRVRRNIMRKGQ